MPDISLLVPLAEQLNVTVAELLQGRRVEEEQRFTREETEDLIRKALTFSAEPPERRQARTKKFVPDHPSSIYSSMTFRPCSAAYCRSIMRCV